MTTPKPTTILLRLEGPLQAWGNSARFRHRTTALEPPKSGVIGLVACCMGRRRTEPIQDLTNLHMAVRIDRPGTLISEFQTVGAGTGCITAQRKLKITAKTKQPETLTTTREYLCDASFLVALTGPPDTIDAIETALRNPVWPPYLGRKACPPGSPIFAGRRDTTEPLDALREEPWRPRLIHHDPQPQALRCVVECNPSDQGARLVFDVPVTFAYPRPMKPRYVRDIYLTTFPVGHPTQSPYTPPRTPRMNYRSKQWQAARKARGQIDDFLCVFCKSPSATTHHLTYRHANDELNHIHELRSLCRRCHDAVSMLEAQHGLATDRIDPNHPVWRQLVLQRRLAIDATRTRRRENKRR